MVLRLSRLSMTLPGIYIHTYIYIYICVCVYIQTPRTTVCHHPTSGAVFFFFWGLDSRDLNLSHLRFTRLALQLILDKGFKLFSFQLPDLEEARHCYLLSLPLCKNRRRRWMWVNWFVHDCPRRVHWCRTQCSLPVSELGNLRACCLPWMWWPSVGWRKIQLNNGLDMKLSGVDVHKTRQHCCLTSQAPSPESNPNLPLPVIAMVIQYITI